MINRCYVGGIIISKEFKVRETSTGKKKLNFVIAHKREYKESGKYKDDLILVDCWKPTTIDYILKYCECGSRVVVEGEMKVDTTKDEKGVYHNRVFIALQDIHPVTYKRNPPEEVDEDYGANVAQVDWGDGF